MKKQKLLSIPRSTLKTKYSPPLSASCIREKVRHSSVNLPRLLETSTSLLASPIVTTVMSRAQHQSTVKARREDDKRRMKRRRKGHARPESSGDHLRNRRSKLSTHPLLLTTIHTNLFQGVPCRLQTPLPPSHKFHKFLKVRAEINSVKYLRRSPLLKTFKKSRNNSLIP